jgi:hypothetical protein
MRNPVKKMAEINYNCTLYSSESNSKEHLLFGTAAPEAPPNKNYILSEPSFIAG